MLAPSRGPRRSGLISCCFRDKLLWPRPHHKSLLLLHKQQHMSLLLLLLLLFLLLLLPLAESRCCSCRLAFIHFEHQASSSSSLSRGSTRTAAAWLRPPPSRSSAAQTPWGPLFGALSVSATVKACTLTGAQAAASAAASPEQAGAPSAAAPAASAAAAAAAAGRGEVVGRRPLHYNVGQRRREDRRENWHRQYVYGPVDPTSAYRRKASSEQAAAAAAETAGSPELLLQLAPQRRPAGKRWTLLEELEAGEKALQAASSAAREALGRLVASARGGRDAGGGPQEGGPSRRRARASGGGGAPETSVQVQLRRAALRAAAEAIEEELRCMQRRDSEEGEIDLWGEEEGASEALVGWGPRSKDKGAPVDTHAQWGPRMVYAASLRQLLIHRASLSAAGPLRGRDEGEGGPQPVTEGGPQPVTEGGPQISRPFASTTWRETQTPSEKDGSSSRSSSSSSSSKDSSDNSSSNSSSSTSSSSSSSSRPVRLPLLAALLPREGVTQRPSSALLSCQLLSTAAFDETIEVHVHLKRRGSSKGTAAAKNRLPQRVQGFATLPFGTIPSLLDSYSRQQEGGPHSKGGPSSEGGPLTKGGPPSAAAEAQQVRGKKKGGIWRRPRVIAALVEAGDEEAAKAAGKETAAII
ncbi:hypothetical protein Emag_006664 [Eimeria magna]